MISSDILRGYNDLFVLTILQVQDSYGYEISKEIIRISNSTYNMKETTLYSIFSRLEKNGYISSYYGELSLGSRRTYYRITKEGAAYLNEKISEWYETQALVNQFIRRENHGKDNELCKQCI